MGYSEPSFSHDTLAIFGPYPTPLQRHPDTMTSYRHQLDWTDFLLVTFAAVLLFRAFKHAFAARQGLKEMTPGEVEENGGKDGTNMVIYGYITMNK